MKLIHDVHEHLTGTGAVEFAKRMEPYQMFFVEDILPPEQIDWFRQIKKVTTTPMAMGELFTSPREYVPLISERVIDFIRCRVSQVGGITAVRKIAALCEEFGVRTAWQEGGDNDPVNQLAAWHVDMAIPCFGIQEENHFPASVHDLLPGHGGASGRLSLRQRRARPRHRYPGRGLAEIPARSSASRRGAVTWSAAWTARWSSREVRKNQDGLDQSCSALVELF